MALQIAITAGEAMKIAKFFRFLRTFIHQGTKKTNWGRQSQQ